MDLLSICKTLWRHKFAVAPVLVLTVICAGVVLLKVKPVYETSASLVLINPPAGPTPEQRAADPVLAGVRSENPYTRFEGSAIVINVVSRKVGADATREALVAKGADERYEVLPSNRYGFASPIVDIVGVGDSPETAMLSARLVSEAVNEELQAMQESEGTDPDYMISTRAVEVPDRAVARISGRLRSLIAVFGLGAILTFILVTILQALDQRRQAAERAPIVAVRQDIPPQPRPSQRREVPREAKGR